MPGARRAARWQPLPVLICQVSSAEGAHLVGYPCSGGLSGKVVPAVVAYLVGCSCDTTMFLFNDVPNRLACPEVENLGQSGASSRKVMSGEQT
jgi:hypothetical protein